MWQLLTLQPIAHTCECTGLLDAESFLRLITNHAFIVIGWMFFALVLLASIIITLVIVCGGE